MDDSKPVCVCVYVCRHGTVYLSQLELTDDHVSKVYCLPRTEAKTTFPLGLPKTFGMQVRMCMTALDHKNSGNEWCSI